jgi:DNA-binding MarR family transcriptional regulator
MHMAISTPKSRRTNGVRRNGARSAGAQAWQLMIEFFQAQRHHFERAAATFELTKLQAQALHVLVHDGPRSMSDLAESLACDASNVTGLIDRLEARGLVERKSVPKDRRMRMLAVTSAGTKLFQRLRELVAEPPPAIDALRPEVQRQLRDALLAVRDGDRTHP